MLGRVGPVGLLRTRGRHNVAERVIEEQFCASRSVATPCRAVCLNRCSTGDWTGPSAHNTESLGASSRPSAQ